MSAPAAAAAILSAARDLKQLLGSRANDTVAVREHHSHGESYHTPAPPDIVCFPHTTAEVAAIVTIAATSVVVCGKQTMSGAAGVWYDSPWL